MASSRRLAANVAAGAFTNFARIGIQIVMLPLMARLLGPEEMGLYALALPVLSFVLSLSDAGLGNSLAQEKSDKTLVWSSAFWALLGAGLFFALVVYGASFPIAHAAHQPRLPGVILALSATLLMVAGTVIPGALMLREGKMSYGAVSELIANVLGAALAVILALNGFGVWSMVAQYIAMYLIRMVLFNLWFPFLPRFEFDFKSLLSHSSISGGNIGLRLINLAGIVTENAVVSRLMGPIALGAYGYANQIARFFTEALANPLWLNLYYVASNEERPSVYGHFLHAQRIYALAMFPGAAMLALSLPTIVPLLLGDEWRISIYPMMAMVLAYPFSTLSGQFLPVVMAWKRIKLLLYTSAILAAARVVVVVLCYPYGLNAIAFGLVGVSLAGYAFSVWMSARLFGVKAGDQVQNILGPLAASIAAGLCMYLLMGRTPALVLLIAAGIASGLVYGAALYLIDKRRVKADFCSVSRLLQKREA